MKKVMFMVLAVCLMTACSSDNGEEQSVFSGSPVENETKVTLTFTPYDVSAMTRAAVSVADYCTHLDVWIMNGEDVIDVHQSSSDSGFGSLSVSLNRLKTYSIVAVAHKCTDNATLSDGTVISFPDDKVTHSMVYSTTFSPATTTELSCLMQRIVGWFRLEIADAVPDNVKKIVYSIPETFNRWNISGTATNQIDRAGTINLTSTNPDGTANINLYVMPSSLTVTDTYDITISARALDDSVIEEKTFEDVPIRAGYKTTYHGQFFTTKGMSAAFVIDDWSAYDTVDF